jgi:SET domain-containing protein
MNTMKNLTQHFFSDKLEARNSPETGGYAVFAKAPVAKGELLAMWGGDIVNGEQLKAKSQEQQSHSIQVWDDLFQVSYRDNEDPAPADYFNHSCTPNAGLCSPISLEAMRDIEAGEEVCFDYAMSDSTDYDEFQCACGTAHCRGEVKGTDWQRPELQARYGEYFSPYLKRRIAGK